MHFLPSYKIMKNVLFLHLPCRQSEDDIILKMPLDVNRMTNANH